MSNIPWNDDMTGRRRCASAVPRKHHRNIHHSRGAPKDTRKRRMTPSCLKRRFQQGISERQALSEISLAVPTLE